MDLLPAIDLRHGRVVRLLRGQDSQRTEYDLDPLETLLGYGRAGVQMVHVVDLDAALGEAPQRDLVAGLAGHPEAPAIELGGGLRDRESVAWAFAAGVQRAVITSLLVKDFQTFSELVASYPERIVAALDFQKRALRYAGWTESAPWSLEEACERLRPLALAAVLVTDIDRDGAMVGPNIDLAAEVGERCGAAAIVSGGVSGAADLTRARRRAHIGAAIVGKALYDGEIDLAAALRTASGTDTGLTARVIPCLDVAAGRVVKGVNFVNLRDQGDPAECALRYARDGADEIVFLDITASPERRKTNLDWVTRTAEQVFIPLTVGGGVREVEDARSLLLAGADKVATNTAAVDDPTLLTRIAERFGSQCVVLSVDARRRRTAVRQPPMDGLEGWEVVTHGGRTGTGIDALEWIAKGVEHGAGEILLTSIDSDGTQDGYDLELLSRVSEMVSVPVVASGGAGTIEHLAHALEVGSSAVLAASIFHESTYTPDQVKTELAQRGFAMRVRTS
ncbi:MAG: imidazole glycerol phosphate synthase subunit HisF [Acidobacteriota bacterium]|nr:imidazole glycerol phosphate synthase subunit HisF [Acidobacteriota bacterium]